MTKLRIKPYFILQVLWVFVFVLTLIHGFGLFLGEGVSPRFMVKFDFNQEANIPAFFSAICLFVCSMLLFLISLLLRKSKVPFHTWFWLGLIFLYLSFDEAAGIHEMIIGMTRRTFNLSGYFYYAWVVPYGIFVILLFVVLIPFFQQLPKRTVLLFFLSGMLFVSGAIGFEMLGGNIIQSQKPNGLYSFYYTCEELLEMLGSSLFIYSLLDYIAREIGNCISISNKS